MTSTSIIRKIRPFPNTSHGKQQLPHKTLPVSPQEVSAAFSLHVESCRPGQDETTLRSSVPWLLPCATDNQEAQATDVLFSTDLSLQPPLPESACALRSLGSIFSFSFVKGKGKKTSWLKSRSVKMVLQL